MARLKDRQKAIALRLEGKSYSEIKNIIGVTKGTLSYWLKDYPLSEERIRELRDLNPRRIERYRETRRRNKEKILNRTYRNEKRLIFPLSKRDLFIAGLFLYWGEGGKTKEAELILSNTNPAMIKFFVSWSEKCLGVDREKLKIKLHLYKDMDIKKEFDFWSRELKINKSQFVKPYIKNSNKSNITYKNGFG
ncbi:MAG: hypothetical protein CO020_01420, partial [Candidatus Colwellbacteria bacterium CG_4_9_14_0_2_um_filter_50_12]